VVQHREHATALNLPAAKGISVPSPSTTGSPLPSCSARLARRRSARFDEYLDACTTPHSDFMNGDECALLAFLHVLLEREFDQLT
jgi:hypothetical protein